MDELLFDIGTPRDFHESQRQCEEALQLLRVRPLTKKSFEQDWKKGGCRLAPAIDILRNGWGFEIGGDGSTKNPYYLLDRKQWPSMVRKTDAIQNAYYETNHWKDLCERRFQIDSFRCVSCVGSCRDEIQCHHITYNLFAEKLDELLTVCTYHHELIHESCRLAFPTGVEVWVAERLLGVAAYEFEGWLRP